jgi:predicted nucleic-acid-binding Zn-ribbon protein
MQNGICPKCNSHVIIKNQPVMEHGQGNLPLKLSITIPKRRRSGWFSSPVTNGNIRAWICGQCGYTELYTTNFKELLEADRELQSTGK